MKKVLIVIILFAMLIASFSVLSVNADSNQLDITSKEAVLMSEMGEVLYSHNALDKRPIASMTKIMTLLCIYDSIDQGKITLDEQVTVSSNASGMGGSQVFLDANSTHIVSQLVKSIIVCSANDSCVAMAEHICGSEAAFVGLMNEKVKQLALENTQFNNCTGLPTVDQYSCAVDVGHMMIELSKYDHYKQCAKIWMEDYQHPDGRVIGMTNTNKLVKFYPGCDGGKTGFTNEAMFCLATTAIKGETRLYAVVIGVNSSANRFAECSALLNYGFANYECMCIADCTTKIDNIEVVKGKKQTCEVALDGRLVAFGKKGNVDVYVEYELPKQVQAPIISGDIIGIVKLYVNGELTSNVNIVACEDVESKTYMDYLTDIICGDGTNSG